MIGARCLKTQKREAGQGFSRKVYTTGEVSAMTGVSLRQLQWWDEQNVVSPHREGRRRLYTPENAGKVAVVAELRRKGLMLRRIRRVLPPLQHELDRRRSELIHFKDDLYLVTDGKHVHFEVRTEKIIDLLKKARGPMYLVCVSDQFMHVDLDRAARRSSVA